MRKGFSLVELLVVIAIIMVLIALLLPMTLRLEDAVNTMIDVSNFKKIYGAMYAFAEDHKGHIPHLQGGQLYTWMNSGSKALADKLGVPWSGTSAYDELYEIWPRSEGVGMITAYKEYVSEDPDELFSVFHCPSPRASVSYYSSTNYDFRLENDSGETNYCKKAPPGGWVIGTHNPRAHIVQDYINTFVHFSHSIDFENQKRSPFDLRYYVYPDKDEGTYSKETWSSHVHMGNKWPRLRLDGTASVLVYDPWWGARGSDRGTLVMGGWFPGSGGI